MMGSDQNGSKRMVSPILNRRKWMVRAHGQHIVIVKGTHERFTHPLMKALIWAMYLPSYPNMTIEVRIGDRYKPDVVAFAPDDSRLRENEPIFWGEAGQVSRGKIESLVRRYPDTHFCVAKWQTRLRPYVDLVEKALMGVKRNAPFDLISFPDESIGAIDDAGNIIISHDDVIWQRFE